MPSLTSALRTVARSSAVPLRSRNCRLPAPACAYSTQRPPPSAHRTRANPLVAAAAVGFTSALVYRLANDYVAADKSIKCDGAAAVSVVETFGKDWTPVEALEADDPANPMSVRMSVWVKNLQDHIVRSLEAVEASAPPCAESPSLSPPIFLRDHWLRAEGGEGSSCVLSGGRVFEKAGVNVSVVHGMLPPAAQRQMRAEHAGLPVSDTALPFFATGLSIVIHPRNPHAPTCHLNYRYFELRDPARPDGAEPLAWWFGGGSDLTPAYLYEADAALFHDTLKAACDGHDKAYYPAYKKWCDKYFYIPHRAETRGVGGIFFDDLTTASPIHAARAPTKEAIFEFVKSAGAAFLPAYVPIVLRRMHQPYTDEERRWQLIRRGRYVEFNLVYDRGTKFGLMTPGARIESILMSLPETARWEYMTPLGAPGSGTREEKLVGVLTKPREWATTA
ncbi:Coproporphyrinogen-III oxidase [Cryptotrichosporon argae]